MLTPPYLKSGSLIGIVAPAGITKFEDIERAQKRLLAEGFKVKTGDHLYKADGFFAGKDKERLSDLQTMIDNPSVKAILCARGGFGTIRIAEQLDLTKFLKNPKWLIGFSDISILHSMLAKIGVESIHGQMAKHIPECGTNEVSFESLLTILKGKKQSYHIQKDTQNKIGTAKGRLTGGNLSILYSLQATDLEIDTRNKILFIEDINENIYHIERMIINLKQSKKFDRLRGLILGYFTEIKNTTPNYGMEAIEIIKFYTKSYDFPIVSNFPAGHEATNFPLIMGRNISLEVKKEETIVTM